MYGLDMHLELQCSIRQDVSAALYRSGIHECDSPDDSSKWECLRKGLCCICGEGNIDSLLYRCGHLCTSSKCANELLRSRRKCPMCQAPVLETMSSFSSMGPVPPQAPTLFSSPGPAVRPGAPSFRPTLPGRFNDPSVPPPPHHPMFCQCQLLDLSSILQHPPFRRLFSLLPYRLHPWVGQPSIHHHASQAPPFPSSLHSQPQMPYVQMWSPPMGSNVPPPPQFQSSVPGYARMQLGAEMQAPPIHSSILANQRIYGPAPLAASSSFAPHQRGYASSFPVATLIGVQPTPQPGYATPADAIRGLTEDFSSLTTQTRPGTVDALFDSKERPTPLDGDAE